MRPDIKEWLHATPRAEGDNLLDKLSSNKRLNYCYKACLDNEKALVEEKIINLISRGRVLNIGCGSNGTERSLFPRSHYEIFGVDINEDSLRILHQKKLYDALYNADISSLPFGSGIFDIVYLRAVLHHLVYPKNILAQGLQECFRVLQTGGILALVEPNSWHPVGALMNLAHRLGIDMYIHGTDDDIALSPLMLQRQLLQYCSRISTHVITYSWRRLPIPCQFIINSLHNKLSAVSNRLPYFGHTLMMISLKH